MGHRELKEDEANGVHVEAIGLVLVPQHGGDGQRHDTALAREVWSVGREDVLLWWTVVWVKNALVRAVVDACPEVGHGSKVDESERVVGLAENDVGWLDVTMHEARGMQLLQQCLQWVCPTFLQPRGYLE